MDRIALADFLRRHRERLRPGDVGLAPTSSSRRRTPGLRREEVAWLADLSANYYERLEQARAPRPSPRVLAALGRVLQLGPDEQRYLTRVAGHELTEPGSPDDDVPVGIRQLVERLSEMPAYVLNPKYDVLAWNRLAAQLIIDFDALAPSERNLLRIAFGPRGHRVVRTCCGAPDGETHFVRQAVAELRNAAIRYPDDPEIPELIMWIAGIDEEFKASWQTHGVRPEPTLWKRFEHPRIGTIELDAQTIQVPERDQRLIILSAEPGSAAAKALQELNATGG